MGDLTYYFDYLSPYSFFAWQWIGEFCDDHDLELCAEPVVLGALLSHWGHLGPAEIPAKREFMFRDCLRVASEMGLDFEMPAYHPFNPLVALRVSLRQVTGEDQHTAIDAIWNAGWVEGGDLGDREVIAAALTDVGLDGEALVAETAEPRVKEALKSNTSRAIERGVFGVPTFTVGGEFFWGNDQRDAMRRWVDDGERGYDEADLERLLTREPAVRRNR